MKCKKCNKCKKEKICLSCGRNLKNPLMVSEEKLIDILCGYLKCEKDSIEYDNIVEYVKKLK